MNEISIGTTSDYVEFVVHSSIVVSGLEFVIYRELNGQFMQFDHGRGYGTALNLLVSPTTYCNGIVKIMYYPFPTNAQLGYSKLYFIM
jgi:hypothetical protein